MEALLLSVLVPRSLPAQEDEDDLAGGATAYFVSGLGNVDRYGRQLAVLGDLDGDGVKDFATSGTAAGLKEAPADLVGHVDVLSGRTGALLRRWFGEMEFEDLGRSLGALPDADGDGVLEVGAVNFVGRLYALSPVSGETWYSIPDREGRDTVGSAVLRRISDADGDGVEEVVYVETFSRTEYVEGVGRLRGRALGLSGRSGEVLWERLATTEEGMFAIAAVAGDWNEDGVDDVLVASNPGGDAQRAPLIVLSGRDGELLETIPPREELRSWGGRLVSLGDHDGNGFPELLVGAPVAERQPGDEVGWIGVYRLPEFRLAWSAFGRHGRGTLSDWSDRLSISASAAGDVDGDGAEDVLAGTFRVLGGGLLLDTRYGYLYVYSGRTGELLMVYGADHALFEETFPGFLSTAFFEVVSPLDDIDSDGYPDFLIGRPSNASASPLLIAAQGIVRAIRYRPDRPRFIRGDANGDGRVGVTDAVTILRGIVAGQEPACAIAWDVSGLGTVSMDDAVQLLTYYFRMHNEEPAPPFPECGRYDVVHPYIELGCADEGSCATP